MRSLYCCGEAKVVTGTKGPMLVCQAGHDFPARVTYLCLERGNPLELAMCQDCPDYREIGPPVPRAERGW